MVRTSFLSTARNLRAVFILASLFAAAAVTYAAGTVAPNVTIPAGGIAAPASAGSKALSKPHAKPVWSELTPVQQQALAPLSAEWDKLEPIRKTKWLEIANKYAKMNPDEQLRMQERMREWVKLTPEQRRIARESYARAKKLNPNQKSEKWQEYQQLPEDQKKKLAADSASKKPVVNLPPAKSKIKTVPPIKSTPKPILEQSVTPQATNMSVLQPSVPPTTPLPANK